MIHDRRPKSGTRDHQRASTDPFIMTKITFKCNIKNISPTINNSYILYTHTHTFIETKKGLEIIVFTSIYLRAFINLKATY